MLVSGERRAVRDAGLPVVLAILGTAWGGPPSAGISRPFHVESQQHDGIVLSVDPAALAERGGAFVIDQFPLAAGTAVDLEVERFRVTGPDTRFVVGRESVPVAFDPERVILLRGRVAGETGSHVFMALSEWGSIGRIERGGGNGQYFLSGSGSSVQVRRAGERLQTHPGALSPDVPFCAVVAQGQSAPPPPPQPAGAVNPEVTQEIEIAIETDYEYYSLFGDLDAASAYMVEMWAAVSDIYQRDVNARIELTFVRLWDTPNDMFNDPDPLNSFRSWWEANMDGVPRDVAQFDSGRRDLPYGGVAYLSALCGGAGYGVVGYILGFFDSLDVPDVWGYDVHVSAHELGHNCGSLHTHDYGIDTCDDVYGPPQRGTIMSYCSQTRSGGNANTDLRFDTITGGFMRDHIFSVGCVVDDCNGNGVADAIDIASGASDDGNGNGVADECEDCNGNGTLDDADIKGGGSQDLNANGVPDECEPDCNGNSIPDDLDIQLGNDTDLYGDNVPDGCEVDCNGNGISDYTDIQADMSLDIDRNAVRDACQDCDGDKVSDMEALGGAHNVWVATVEGGSGLYEFHAVSGVRVKTSEMGAVNNPIDVLITPGGRILVSSADDHRIVEFDVGGAIVGDFVGAETGGLNYPTGMVLAADGDLLVASADSASVLEYDGTSGAPLGTFVAPGAGGLVSPFGIAFGPNGNLFVTSAEGRVIEYDGTTGAPLGDFVTAGGNGGLAGPRGMLFQPDGNLIVASFLTDQILEYDGATGAFIGQFNHGGTATVLTLDSPWGLRLGPDGYVYASRYDVSVGGDGGGGHDDHEDDIEGLHINSTRIYVFDAGSGNFVRSHVTGHDTGLSLPRAFDFYPGDAADCNLNQLPDSCDIASGFSSDGNGNGTPDECEGPCPGDFDGDGAVGIADLLALLAAWGANPGHPADLDGDDVVGIADLLALLATWGPCA